MPQKIENSKSYKNRPKDMFKRKKRNVKKERLGVHPKTKRLSKDASAIGLKRSTIMP